MKYLFYFKESVNYENIYPLAGETVDGREVLEDIPNTSSISASLYKYEILKGVREVSMDLFDLPNSLFKDQKEVNRCKNLSKEIEINNKISPLIVVVDKEGPYILEGAHRFDALYYLQAKSFPALVVIDLDNN